MILSQKIQSSYSIYDYSNILLGGFDNIIQGLLKLNPKFESLDVNLSDFVTDDMNYDDAYYVSKSPQIQISAPQNQTTLYYIPGYNGQSIYDINLMGYSGFNHIVQFCKDNDINSINELDVSGIRAKFDSTVNTDISLKSVISSKGYVFATGVFRNAPNFLLRQDGGYLLRQDGGRFIRNGN